MSSFFPSGSDFFSSTSDIREDTRKFAPIEGSTDIYVDNDSGDDDSGDGSAGNPYASITRALLDTSPIPEADVWATINLVNTGTQYEVPHVLAALRRTKIVGEVIEGETRTVTAVNYQANNRGVSVDVDGAVLANEAWTGQILRVSGGTQLLHVTRNVGNTLYGFLTTLDGNNGVSQSGLSTSTTLTLTSRPVAHFPNSLIFTSNYQLRFEDLEITTGVGVFFASTGRVDFWRSLIKTPTLAGDGRGRFLAFAATFIVRDKCEPRALLNNVAIIGMDPSTMTPTTGDSRADIIVESPVNVWNGGAYFRNLQAIHVQGDRLTVNSAGPGDGTTKLGTIFDNEIPAEVCGPIRVSSRVPTDADFPYSIGAGGTVYLADTYGGIDGDYAIVADAASQVVMTDTVSLSTDTEDNAVSADGGSSASSWTASGTSIYGGTPAYMPGHQTTGPVSDDISGAMEQGLPVAYNTSANEWMNPRSDDLATFDWTNDNAVGVAAGDNAAQGIQFSGEVTISGNLIDGTPVLNQALYLSDSGTTEPYTATKPSTAGWVGRIVGHVRKINTGSPNTYVVRLASDSAAVEIS